MKNLRNSGGLSRRDFLKIGGGGALTLLTGGAIGAAARRLSTARAAAVAASETSSAASASAANAAAAITHMRVAATDGFMQLPGRDPLYVFGFVRVPVNSTINELDVYKGLVQVPSPIIATDEGADHILTLTNIGLVIRPDLDDSHTIHWHGFRNPNAVFDGVPEVSIAVPVARNFPYFYRPHGEGTYMYHCHFEDTEHVQMQMDGIVYVRPDSFNPSAPKAYDPDGGISRYDRHFTLLLNDIDPSPHDLLENVQEFVWSDYKAQYWVINGRAYPDTLLPNNHASLPQQPLSSLIQVNPGDRVLLRFANLGYELQSMRLDGISMKVVGEDATLLRGPGGEDLSYATSTLFIGPGEARDVIFIAPPYVGPADGSDANGNYNAYWLRNRNSHRLTNGGAAGLGGQITQVRVYQSAIGPQTHPNQTYPEFPSPAPYLDPWIG